MHPLTAGTIGVALGIILGGSAALLIGWLIRWRKDSEARAKAEREAQAAAKAAEAAKPRPSVFVSHSQSDADLAGALADVLKLDFSTEEVYCMALPNQITPGEDWLDRLREKLNKSKVVLVLLTPKSISSPWLHFEAGIGWGAHKVIVPCVVGKVDVKALPDFYTQRQLLWLGAELAPLIDAVRKGLGTDTLRHLGASALFGRLTKKRRAEVIAEFQRALSAAIGDEPS